MDDKLIQAIMAHAEAEYPRECCGVLAQKSRITKYFPCRNLSVDPTEHFHLDPGGYADAEDWGAVIGIVHSHPDATTQPSELDKAQCDATELPWHIVSWPEGDLRTIQPRGELPLLERPFVLGHSDCWGLVMSYFRQTHSIELTDYRVDYPWWEKQYPDNFYHECWYECGFREFSGAPAAGDLVIMQIQSDKWNHAGILLEGNMLLHHMYGRLSQRVPYGGYWRERTMKIVRHKDLM
ncbi:peptidase P60 [Rahnella sp. AA]|uniref:C40 family peptidase n=1 Tax=Rahnella sp. AA TaxID=2057180 RepID=UPI000C332F59|nr:C40 family peptidase [Rahnella sp. AA]PKE30952.1 peptidase P60 [Rahnella sp. AA]